MWYDPNFNVIIYEKPDARLLELAIGAKQISTNHVAMPATMTNLQVARLLGLNVIRPLKNYDYPRGKHIKQPFFAQTETANFLVTNPRACVLSDMGTGKTLSALWAADALMRDAETRGERLRAIVVAPLSTLQTVWADAIFQNFLGRRRGVIVHGDPAKRLKQLEQDADFYITNHDGIKAGARFVDSRAKRKIELGGFIAALSARADVRLAIIDEVGGFRDHTTLRSRAAYAFLKTRDFVWLMSGTPTPNGPLDAYGIAKLLNNARGELFTNYRNRIMMQLPGLYNWAPKKGASEEAKKMMTPSIRFSIEQCVDLPELQTVHLACNLSREQEALIRELKREFLLELKAGKGVISAVNQAALRTKLLQIAAGVVYDDNHDAHIVDCAPRLAALRELIDTSLGKTLIFAPFVSALNRLNGGLTDYSRAIIYGGTATQDRIDIIRAFQDQDDPRVLIAHPETIAEGQTLTAAATVVWWSPTDKTRLYLQGNKRIHRPGQTRNCTVVNIAGSKTETEIYRRLIANEEMQGVVLKLAEEGV